MKKRAFTLAEIMICIVIMGVIAVVMMANLRINDFNERNYISSANKVMDEFEKATTMYKELEKTSCPSGSFMSNVMNTYYLSVYNASGAASATATEFLTIYSNHMRMTSIGAASYNIATNNKTCPDGATCAGARLPGNMYIGLEILVANDTVAVTTNCTNYFLPNSATNYAGKGKCWANLYMDTDGTKGNNRLGEDMFVFGINEKGLAY